MRVIQGIARGIGLLVLCLSAIGAGVSVGRWSSSSEAAARVNRWSVPRELSLKEPVPSTSLALKSSWQSMRTDPAGQRFRDGLVITGITPHRLVLFTFDDGPDRRTTPRLLDYLDNAGIKAVFFLMAERIRGENPREREQAEIARDIVRRGHLIANHTLTHRQLPLLSDEEIRAEIDTTHRIFRKVVGFRPWLFRPPGGAHTQRVDSVIESYGYTIVVWNLGAGDFQVRTTEEVIDTWRRVFERREREEGDQGGIILLHDTHAWSVEAVPLLIEELKIRNCNFLRRGEELYDIVDDVSLFYTSRGAAAPGTDAPPAMPEPGIIESRQRRLRETTEEYCRSTRAPVPLLH